MLVQLLRARSFPESPRSSGLSQVSESSLPVPRLVTSPSLGLLHPSFFSSPVLGLDFLLSPQLPLIAMISQARGDLGGSSLGESTATPLRAFTAGFPGTEGCCSGAPLFALTPRNSSQVAALLTPTRWPSVTERPMDRAGEPTGLVRRESVEEKMQRASWKVRISSTTIAWPCVVLLLSCKGRVG